VVLNHRQADLADQALADMARVLKGSKLVLELDGIACLTLLGNLQLALRHPANRGLSSNIALEIARRIEGHLSVTPALRALCAMGWRPEFDQDPDDAGIH